jgi:alkyldihydroxyacetonephosphate synthase
LDDLDGLRACLPAGAVSTHHGELAARAHDRWALALLREVRGDRVAPPAAIAWPSDASQVAAVLAWAEETGTAVVVRGGGTGRAGGAQAVARSVLLDTSRMSRVLAVDDVSQVVRAQAGIRCAELEAQLSERGLTLGVDGAARAPGTLGGWIAGAGRGDGVPLGVEVVLAGGATIRMPEGPEWASGPDLRRLVAGSEGAYGVVTEASVSLRRAPAELAWEVFRPHSFDAGLSLVREIAQRPFRAVVLRLFDPSGAGMRFAAFGEGHRPLLLTGFDGGAPASEAERFELRQLAREFGARPLGRELADHWWAHPLDDDDRYAAVMGSERALGRGVVADSLEVSSLWRTLPRAYEDVRGALLDRAEAVGARLERASPAGGSLVFDFVIRAEDDRRAERAYLEAWDGAAAVARDRGGTLGGEGVGLASVHRLAAELGEAGAATSARIRRAFDPRGVMNPGKVLPPTGYDGPP